MPVLAALLAVVFWSSNALSAKIALADIGVFQILLFQFLSAFLTLLALAFSQKGNSVFSTQFYSLKNTIIGTSGVTLTILLQYLAFSYGNILESNLIAYSWPLFVSLGTGLFLRNENAFIRVILALIGFTGTILLLDKEGDLELANMLGLGAAFAFASAITMAVYSIKANDIDSPQSALIPATLLGAVFSAFCLLLTNEFTWSVQSILVSSYIGVGPMALGYYFWTYAMSNGGSSRLAPLGYATPLLSTVVLLISGEQYTIRTIIGIVIVLTSTTMTLAISGKKVAANSKR